ncbi:MAG: hypothetical protein R2733_21010 [Acidimicrobiales bacterium]
MTPFRPMPLLIMIVSTAAVVAASCGLPEQDQAQAIDDLPEDLLAVTTTTTTAPAAVVDDAPYELVLYWHESDQGGRLIRKVRLRSTPPTPQEALQELIGGPVESEVAETEGVEFFGPNAGLKDAELNPIIEGPVEGIVTVVVSGTGFRELPNKANAAEELVCTLTEFDAIDGLVVRDAQPEPIGLVGRNSESIEGPARRENFDDCATPDLPPDAPDSSSTSTG